MSSLSKLLSILERIVLVSDRFVTIEWLFVFACADLLLGFSLSGLIFRLILPANAVYMLSTFIDTSILAAFGFYIFQSFDFAQLYAHWIRTSVRDPGDLARLNETISLHGLDNSFESRQIFRSTHENSSLLMHDTSVYHSMQQRSLNTSENTGNYSINQNLFNSNEKSTSLPAFVLISSKSPYSSRLYTEGHYNSMSFSKDVAKPLKFDEDFFTNKKLDWIFNTANLSSTDHSTGSYQVGFIMKEKAAGDNQKIQRDDEDYSNYVNTELSADDGTESIFANRQKKNSSKLNASTKRDELLKKLMDWHEDKNTSLEDSLKQKQLKSMMEDLLATATIHRITFNNSVAADLAYFSANLRSFISKSVLQPIIKAIDETNLILAQSNAKFSIGTSAVDVLTMAMEQKPDLCSTQMPYLLPFLRIHPNQTLLFNTMRQFAQNPFVLHESVASISFEKLNGFGTVKAESEFLSEAEFIFAIFCTYLDYRMAANSFALCSEKPFTSVYVLKESEKPSFVQLNPKSFFIYTRNKKTTSFEFAINGGSDFYLTPTKDTESMFASFMLMFIYCKQFNNGYLGDMLIEHTGLDVLRLFRSH